MTDAASGSARYRPIDHVRERLRMGVFEVITERRPIGQRAGALILLGLAVLLATVIWAVLATPPSGLSAFGIGLVIGGGIIHLVARTRERRAR